MNVKRKYRRDILIMQEKRRDISIFKERINEYLDKKGISKYECYQKTGMSRSVLSQPSGMTEDNLLRFLDHYTDINIEWLILGKGRMLIESNSESANSSNAAKIVIEMELSNDDLVNLQLKKQLNKTI